jgi:hypothetical protein
MATEAPIVLRFTSEELAALLEVIAAPAAHLDYEDLLPEYSAEQRALAILVARRSLLARNIIQADEAGGYHLDPLAQAAVAGTLRQDPAVVVFNQHGAGDLTSAEFHSLAEGILLSHSEPANDVHELALYPSTEAYRQAILASLALAAESNLGCPPGKIEQAKLSRSIELAEAGDAKAALAELAKSALPKKTAQELAATLAGPHDFKTLVLLENQADSTSEGQTLAFLQGSNGLWRLEGLDGDEADSLVALAPLSNAAAQETVQQFLNLD